MLSHSRGQGPVLSRPGRAGSEPRLSLVTRDAGGVGPSLHWGGWSGDGNLTILNRSIFEHAARR